jgi:hypothetical protein
MEYQGTCGEPTLSALGETQGMDLHGQKIGGAILPDTMRQLWREVPVSTDPNDMA